MLVNQKMMVAFVAYYSELVKMVSTRADKHDFFTHLDEFMRTKTLFSSFALSLIPSNLNTKIYSLARSARFNLIDTIYVNFVLPILIYELF